MTSEFEADIKNCNIGEKFRFIGEKEALAWHQLCLDTAYRPYWDSVELLNLKMTSILKDMKSLNSKEIDFICLGVGSGMKENIILRKILNRQSSFDYYLVDASMEMIRLSLIYFANHFGGSHKILSGRGIFGDLLSNLPPLPKLNDDRLGLYALLGNTIGNYPDYKLLDAINRMMESGDFIMIDSQLLPDNEKDAEIKIEIKKSYDNKLLKKFVMTPLYKIKGFRDDLGEVQVRITDSHPSIKGRAITVIFEWIFSEAFRIGNNYFRKDDPLGLGYSVKYDLHFLKEIIKESGFIINNEYILNNNYYGIVLAQKK